MNSMGRRWKTHKRTSKLGVVHTVRRRVKAGVNKNGAPMGSPTSKKSKKTMLSAVNCKEGGPWRSKFKRGKMKVG